MLKLRPRRAPLLFLILVLLVISILLHRSRFLIGLLFEDGSRDAIPANISNLTEHKLDETKLLIPKIIHQTYKDENLPEHWAEAQNVTKILHEDYEYMFWTDASALTFIQTRYPWFLQTYKSYSYPIQRVDALRYFLLYHYGGIYLDLDISPCTSFTPLLQYPAFACRTEPTGISNDMLGSIPRHPFYTHVVESLEAYDRWWGMGYITVMYSTGPLFISALWIQYIWNGSEGGEAGRLRLLMKSEVNGDSYGFFRNIQGGSWHGRDFAMILWMERHWVWVIVLGCLIVFIVIGGVWFVFRELEKFVGIERGRGRGRRSSREREMAYRYRNLP